MAGLIQQEPEFGSGTYLVDSIPVSEWDAVARSLSRSRPLRVTVREEGDPPHAWQTRLQWDPLEQNWNAQIRAGYVNDDEVSVRIPSATAPERTRQRLGWREAARGTELDAWLSEEPVVAIPAEKWRAIGSDADVFSASEAVPEYFLGLGVEPQNVSLDTSGPGGVTMRLSGTLPDAKKRRLLRAADIVLTHPRPALVAEWGTDPGGLVLQLGVRMPGDGEGPTVSVVQKFEPTPGVEIGGQLVSGFVDDGFDERFIATVYLLSPGGAAAGSVPEASWQPYVQHRTFYDLRHDVDQELAAIPEQSLSFPVPLAGGVGSALVRGMLDEIDDAANQVAAFLNASRIRGRFWT